VTAFTPRAAAVSSVLGDDKDTLSAAVIYTAVRLTDFTVIENSIVRGHQGYSSAHLRLSAGPRALAFQSPTCICFSGSLLLSSAERHLADFSGILRPARRIRRHQDISSGTATCSLGSRHRHRRRHLDRHDHHHHHLSDCYGG